MKFKLYTLERRADSENIAELYKKLGFKLTKIKKTEHSYIISGEPTIDLNCIDEILDIQHAVNHPILIDGNAITIFPQDSW